MVSTLIPTRRRVGRRSAGLVLLLLACVLGSTACLPDAHAQRSIDLANNERSARGIADLAWDDEAAAKAQNWAEHMAAVYAISHSNLTDGISGRWSTLAENVGVGPSIDAVHNGFMNSPRHRDAILGGRYRSMGVGVAQRNGMIFVAQVFRG